MVDAVRSLIPAVALCAGLGVAGPAGAWGYEGHKVVCAIAQEELAPELRAEVLRLARAYRTPDGWTYRWFTTSCVFADTARDRARTGRDGWGRFHRFSRWHYMNLPRTARRLERREAGDHCAGDCVLEGIRYHAARLGDATLADQERGEALLFLGHWLGDVHQPFHVSYADDLGGHRIDQLEGGGYRPRTLHGVWDLGITMRARGGDDWWSWAGELARRTTPEERAAWLTGDAVTWAAESYELVIDPAVRYCTWRDGACRSPGPRRALDDEYQERFQPVVERRLRQAGVRLADVIRRALGSAGDGAGAVPAE